jgi:hypothetical protein
VTGESDIKKERKVNNIEELMTELARASVALKGFLYLQDSDSSTTPEGTDGPRTRIHICRVCGRAAAGKEAQVHHEPNCALARLQRAQKALRKASPEMFTPKPAPAPPAAPDAQAPMSRRAVVPAAIENDQPPASSTPPEPQAPQRRVRQRGRAACLGAVHQGAPVPAAPVFVPPSQVRRAPGGHPEDHRHA